MISFLHSKRSSTVYIIFTVNAKKEKKISIHFSSKCRTKHLCCRMKTLKMVMLLSHSIANRIQLAYHERERNLQILLLPISTFFFFFSFPN